MKHEHEGGPRSPVAGKEIKSNQPSPFGWIVLGLAVIGLIIYLVSDHLPHLVGALPYIGLIAVVIAHFFMHRGHSHHGSGPAGHNHGKADQEERRS